MPSRSASDAKTKATHDAAMAIIAAEKKKRDEKTARLRAEREAAGPDEPRRKTSKAVRSRKPKD